jgi:hypothetical protein
MEPWKRFFKLRDESVHDVLLHLEHEGAAKQCTGEHGMYLLLFSISSLTINIANRKQKCRPIECQATTSWCESIY